MKSFNRSLFEEIVTTCVVIRKRLNMLCPANLVSNDEIEPAIPWFEAAVITLVPLLKE